MPKDSDFRRHKESEMQAKALVARKEFLLKELVRISNLVKQPNFDDSIEADIQLSVLDKLEATYEDLVKETLTVNTVLNKEDEICMNDLNTCRQKIDSIRKHCIVCKLNATKEGVDQKLEEGSNLPKLGLPIFSGNIGEWNSFIAQFNSSIHKKKIPKEEKYTYLKSILRDEPFSIVTQYELEKNAYDSAYEALVNRYANPRLLANHYLTKILGFKSFKSFTKYMEIHRAATSGLLKANIKNLADYLLFELCYRNLPLSQQKYFDRAFIEPRIPTLKDLFEFIDNLARSEELHSEILASPTKEGFRSKNPQVLLGVSDDAQTRSCVYCNEAHPLFRCKDFPELPIKQKLEIVQKFAVCKQCLGTHKNACNSKYHCRHCQAKNHHSFLCKKYPKPTTGTSLTAEPTMQNSPKETEKTAAKSCNACLSAQTSAVLLGTIKAHVTDQWGKTYSVRVVCDTGSQVNIITNSLAKRLGLKRTQANVDIQSISQTTPKILGSSNLTIRSILDEGVAYEFNAVILPSICDDLPTESLNIKLPENMNDLPLADPDFRKSQRVDILLGTDAFMDILSTNEPTLIKDQPTAIHTIFGYVLTGRVLQNDKARALTFCTTSLDKTLRSFWEVENLTPHDRTVEDSSCENYFQKTVQRDPSGKYIVRLPFQDDATPLGSNMEIGLKSFSRLENRFRKTAGLFDSYSAVLQDYLDQGHMSQAEQSQKYVLPHHCVYKESSSTAVRVVFNASSPDNTGASLNSRLKSGPKLQNELPHLLITFRLHKIALQADIKQMFRNILLHPEDRKFQQILWRWSPEEEIQQFSLNTVTFGFTSSPYLAQRVLKQLVADEGSPYTEASEAVLHHTFMDDFVTGAPTVEAAKKLRQDLNTLMSKGGFELRKWASSHPEVLDQLPEEYKEKPFVFPTGEEGVKILGLLWDQTSDSLRYHVAEFQSDKITKRTILSYTAKLWDCLGLVSPVVLKAKIFLQQLWLLQVDWDEEVPQTLANEWLDLMVEMPLLRELKIPRLLPVDRSQVCLVGFSDASESAMAANVYLRITLPTGDIEAHLVMSKTKLAPLKTWTIPRLELSAAVLLASIIDYVRRSKLKDLPVYLFTDSQIVLAWLQTPPHNLKIFVANRVIQIKETVPNASWNFVPGIQNPADLASRGLKPSQLLNNKMWWFGPEFIRQPIECWPKTTTDQSIIENCPEMKRINVAQALAAPVVSPEPITQYLDHPSTLVKLQRVMAYILRYVENLKAGNHRTGPLTGKELKSALLKSVQLTQQKYFRAEILALRTAKDTPKGLHKLSPFLDSEQLLRAGGRIRRADSLSAEAKHPLILPKNCHLSHLICDYYHRKLLHAGPKTTAAAIQQKFWIISLRQLVRKRIRSCLRCYRLSAAPSQPLMGDLPRERVNVSRPFTNVAVDFGGPVTTKDSRPRFAVKQKSYLCVFVCLAVKAVHIEAVSELTTKAFLAAFIRFSSRRGLPRKVYSDCGRNFVGAAKHFQRNSKGSEIEESAIVEYASTHDVEWQFTPPYGPNFNGLAEAAIKSAKRLLIRQIGEEILTFEEFSTLLCRIEAVLNSRPLTAMSDDPTENDAYLSPAHFLIGDQIIHPPEEPEGRLSIRDRWQRIQILSLSFWKKWSKDYLNTLLQRHRWTKPTPNMTIGQVVFITGENTPPLQWPLGRIVATHPGEDGVVRVVTIRLAKGEIRRPVNKLLVLPFEA